MSSKKRRNDVTTEIVVGAFMFTILMVLLTLTVVISQNKIWQQAYFMEAVFPDIGGLKEGETVFFRGVRIGNVNEIRVDDESLGVRVKLRLTRPVTLYPDYRLTVEPASMLGGMRLDIAEGSPQLPPIADEDYMNLEGEPVADLLGEATETIQLIRKGLVEDGTLDNIKALTANLRSISDDIQQGRGTIGKLIQEDTLHSEAVTLVQELQQSADDFRKVAENVRTISDRLVQGHGTLGKLLSEDPELYNDLTKTMEEIRAASADARKVMARLEAGEGSLGRLLSPDDQVYEDLQATVASLRKFSTDLEAQQGTIGKLITDDEIYGKVNDLLDEARATLDDFRETSPITTFSSIFFGAF